MKNFLKTLNLIPDKTERKAWFISYFLINFIYLYHTLNFMWGNHDVKFVKEQLFLSSGIFEGRFSQFVPPWLLTYGQILPIITNLLGLGFLTLALWLLAKYWDIPKSTFNLTLFITFFASLPYTLSWLYFTFITLSCLLWVFFVILGLYISSRINQNQSKIPLSILAILCFYLPLGGYPPVINTIAVCFTAKIAISYLFEKKNLKTLFQIHKYTVLNILLAAILFKLTLKLINPDNVYNLETTSLADMPAKFIATIKISYQQFIISLPFMEKGYKITLMIMTLSALVGATIKAIKTKRLLLTLLLIFGTIWSASLTTFIVIPPTQFVARVDFYGLAFIYAFALALLLKFKTPFAHSLALFLMFILIPFNTLNDYRALKIWKQGYDAEFQILDDINTRIEDHPQFNNSKQYRLWQIGDITLRPAYYTRKFEQNEPFLLATPYLASWQCDSLTEFYMPTSFIKHKTPLLPEDITPEFYEFITTKARPYPNKNCLWIDENIIVIIYNQYDLNEFKHKIRPFAPKN